MRSPGKPLSAIVLLALAPLSPSAGELPTAAALLERSIGYHDPEGTWGRKALTLAFDESRPGNRFSKDGVLISLERPALAIDPADNFENVAAAGLMLDDLYANGTDTEAWTELQVALERRANQSFVLTGLGADNEPIDGGWTSIPKRPSE